MSRNRKKGYSRRGIIKSKGEIDRLFRETFANNYQGTFAEDLNSRAISCYPNKRYLFEFSATEKAANAPRRAVSSWIAFRRLNNPLGDLQTKAY